MALRGVPDWHRPLEAGAVFTAFEQPGVWFTAPTGLEPASQGGMVVDRFAQDRGPAGGITRYGVLTLRWDTVSEHAFTAAPTPSGSAPRTLPIDGGLVRLTGPSVLRGPDGEPALGQAFPLDQAGMAAFVAVVSLDDASTEHVIDAHRRGTALIGADVVLVARGVAARHPAVAEVDLAGFTATLAEGTGVVEVESLRSRLLAGPESLGIRFTSAAPGDGVGTAEAAEALLDRILARLTTVLAPPERDEEAVALGARIPARVQLAAPQAGTLRWDLAQPLLAPRIFTLASANLQPGGIQARVTEHSPPALTSGRHRITVATTAVPPWAGGVPGFAIRIPPNPPGRAQAVRVDQLFDGVPEAKAEVRLTPLEPLSGSITGTVLWDTGELTEGEPAPLNRAAQVLRTDSFPARFLPLELSTAMAGCEVAVAWFDNADAAGTPGAEAGLGADALRVTLVAPTVDDAALVVRSTAPDGRTAATDPLPAGPLLVDPYLFPGTGSQTVLLEARFGDDAPAGVTLELVTEGGEIDASAVARRHLARNQPRADWTRFVASPFATGYRWRSAGSPEWSETRPTAAPLRVSVTRSGTIELAEGQMKSRGAVHVAGLRLWRIEEGGREWVFVPEAPTVATQPGGPASLSLVEAGDLHLLTLTGRLTATEEQLVRVREELAERDGVEPAEELLHPAVLASPRADVTVTVDGSTTELASSTTSGVWPYNASLHAQLTGAQADAVRRALAGQPGLLNLRYEAELRPGEGRPRITGTSWTSSTTTTSVTTTRGGPGGTVSHSSATELSESGEHTVDPPDPEVIELAIDLDGADWLTENHS